MDIFIKIILILSFLTLAIFVLNKLNRQIDKLSSPRIQISLQSLLYAVIFTPTAYHHAPNTIIGPFHLSTIGGNLFYPYEYTFSMFATGVLAPISIGFVCFWVVLTYFHKPKAAACEPSV